MNFNTNAEERSGYMVSHEMKLIWQAETDLLQQLLQVCREHGLRCWVDGGTLLGAVRHQGFIPWDDDIDVCMSREDYDRLLSIGTTAFRHPYFLQSAYSDKDYYHGHAQLRNSLTTAVRPSESYRPYNQGIFIDIFVLDAVPEDPQRRAYIIKEAHRIFKFLKAKDTPILVSGRWGLLFRKLKCKYMVRKKGWTAIYKEAEDLLRSADAAQCRYVAELGFSADDILFDKHIFDETLWMDFEHIKVPVPKGYDQFLRTQYGDDYMTPQQAPSYHGELVFSTTQAYRDMLPDIQRQYRRSAWQRLKSKLFRHK
ncbi:MAG: LicD family protein [Prevotella sp.]|nr:LicD family protein [Prevotella sp.]